LLSARRRWLRLARKLSPNLIVFDVSMPVMNGLEAVPILRKSVPNSPIILYTLHADRVIEQQLESAKVDSVVSKQEPLSRFTEEAHALLGA
jgi:DNA-binding NarL/FixJ family response regulator